MCLIIKSGPHIAKKDILVWKVIFKDNTSLHRNFKYSPNKSFPKVKFTMSRYESNLIYAGYHSFKSREIARFNKTYSNLKVVKFYIPKGAKYFIGDDCDIVSNRIRSGDLKPQ